MSEVRCYAVRIMAIGDDSVYRTILIADDEPDFVLQLSRILLNEGYIVLTATDGLAVTHLMDKYRSTIDLVIIDLVLPGKNGFELIGDLTRRKSGLKVIAVSGTRLDVLETALLIGADAIVFKPPIGVSLDAVAWLTHVRAQIGLADPKGNMARDAGVA
jgi:DNA-binding response OmpR family regulator